MWSSLGFPGRRFRSGVDSCTSLLKHQFCPKFTIQSKHGVRRKQAPDFSTSPLSLTSLNNSWLVLLFSLVAKSTLFISVPSSNSVEAQDQGGCMGWIPEPHPRCLFLQFLRSRLTLSWFQSPPGQPSSFRTSFSLLGTQSHSASKCQRDVQAKQHKKQHKWGGGARPQASLGGGGGGGVGGDGPRVLPSVPMKEQGANASMVGLPARTTVS